MKNNKTVTSIFLTETSINKDALEELVQALRRNKVITLLELPARIEDMEKTEEINRICAKNNERMAQKIEHVMRMKKDVSNKSGKRLRVRKSMKRQSNPKMRDENIYGGFERI